MRAVGKCGITSITRIRPHNVHMPTSPAFLAFSSIPTAHNALQCCFNAASTLHSTACRTQREPLSSPSIACVRGILERRFAWNAGDVLAVGDAAFSPPQPASAAFITAFITFPISGSFALSYTLSTCTIAA